MSKNPRKPSILNWMGTILMCSIPGVNLIFLILSAIFARTHAKRAFSIAGILLMLICFVLVGGAFALFPDYFTRLADTMRGIPAIKLT